MIDVSRMQHGLGLRVMMTQSAVLQESQSVPHVVGTIFLLDPYVFMTGLSLCTMDIILMITLYI